MSELLPWLSAPMQVLARARAGNRLPAGLLIQAGEGTGGGELALHAAQLALCRAALPPCGVCTDCRRVEAQQHPDLLWLAPIEDSKLIRVEQVRELTQALSLTAHGGGASVAIIMPADAMNANAANALLKTLEEPRSGVMLVLVTALPSWLPATVLSRCQRLVVAPPTREQSRAWLAQGRPAQDWDGVLDVLGEAPLRAVQVQAGEFNRLRKETADALAQACAAQLDVAATADRWIRETQFDLRLACVEHWLMSRIDAWPQAAPAGIAVTLLLRLLDGVYELRALRNTSMNRALILEQLLWQLARGTGAVAVA